MGEIVLFLPLRDIDNPVEHVSAPYVTWALIALNIIIWLVLATQPESAQTAAVIAIGHYGGPLPDAFSDPLSGPLVGLDLPGLVTALTSTFVHLDFFHLAGNLMFLWVFGDNVEDAMGHTRFLAFYLLCGLAASYAEVTLSPGYFVIGASGAIAGVVVAFVMLHPKVKLWVFVLMRIPLRIGAVWVIAAWAVYQVYNAAVASAGVAWWAHIGGAVAGAALLPLMKRKDVPLFDRGLTRDGAAS